VQSICILLKKDNHASISTINPQLLQLGIISALTVLVGHQEEHPRLGCSSWCPTNIVKALMAIGCWYANSLTAALSRKDVQQIAAMYPQPSAKCKHKSTVKCNNSSYMCKYHCTQQLHIIQYRTVPIIFPVCTVIMYRRVLYSSIQLLDASVLKNHCHCHCVLSFL